MVSQTDKSHVVNKIMGVFPKYVMGIRGKDANAGIPHFSVLTTSA